MSKKVVQPKGGLDAKDVEGLDTCKKTCNEHVPNPNAPPPAPPKPKWARKNPKMVHVKTASDSSKVAPSAPTKTSKKSKKVHVATTAIDPSM